MSGAGDGITGAEQPTVEAGDRRDCTSDDDSSSCSFRTLK